MFTKAILPDTLRAIQLVNKIPAVQSAYLAGGTALALQLGHRVSVDLDFLQTKNSNPIYYLRPWVNFQNLFRMGLPGEQFGEKWEILNLVCFIINILFLVKLLILRV